MLNEVVNKVVREMVPLRAGNRMGEDGTSGYDLGLTITRLVMGEDDTSHLTYKRKT